MLIKTKVSIPDMFLGMLMAIAIFAMGLIIGSSGNQPSQQITNAASGNTNQPENYWSAGWHWLTHDATGLFTLFLVIVGIVQIGVFLRQLRLIRDSLTPAKNAAIAAKESASAQKDEFLASHRPQIRVKHLWLMSDISQQTPIGVKIVCVNTGTTTAKLQQLGIQCHVFGNEYLLPADPNIAPRLSLNNSILTCGFNCPIPDDKPNTFVDTGRVLATHEWADIQRRHAKLYCIGWISYLDDAQPPRMRITGFCRVLEPPDGHTTVTPTNGRFRVCKHPDYEYQD